MGKQVLTINAGCGKTSHAITFEKASKTMKKSHTRLGSHLALKGLLIAAAFGLSSFGANAALVATVPLAGEEFGHGIELHAQSNGLLDAANVYFYKITGTCQGTGTLASFVPPGTKIRDLVNDIEQGAGKSLIGTKQNPGGALPFVVLSKTYSGQYEGADVSLTVKIEIDATGRVKFDVTDVTFTFSGFPIGGTIECEPGAKVMVGVAPKLEFRDATQTVGEGAGTVQVKVDRIGNPNVAVSVRYATKPDTADNADFKPKSGTLNFNAGQTTKTITIQIKDNAIAEPTESFKVVLSKPVAAVLGTPKTTTVNINDND
ncbi:MAG: Calx-beta domain-containing protein [Chthoniobacterales bacterium]